MGMFCPGGYSRHNFEECRRWLQKLFFGYREMNLLCSYGCHMVLGCHMRFKIFDREGVG